MSDFDDKFTKVGALWKNRNGNGYNGNIELNKCGEQIAGEKLKVLIFNNKKSKATQPDMNIYIENHEYSEPEPEPAPSDKDEVPF